jgi:hypothetical protein
MMESSRNIRMGISRPLLTLGSARGLIQAILLESRSAMTAVSSSLVSNPKHSLSCSPDGLISERLFEEEFAIVGASSESVFTGAAPSGDFVEFDFSTIPPKRTELVSANVIRHAQAIHHPNGTYYVSSESRLHALRNGELKLIFDLRSSLSFEGEISIVILDLAADGTLLLATESGSQSCTSLWTIHGLPSSLPKRTSLVASMDVDPDLVIPINGFELKLHKSFAANRCPAFVKNKTAHSQPVDHAALDAFRRFLYSDELPSTATPSQLMGLAARSFVLPRQVPLFNPSFQLQLLGHSADMHSARFQCLKKLEAVQPDQDPHKATAELIGLYCYSLDLANFDDGEKIAMYLLQKHRQLIAPQAAQIQTMLGRHGHRFFDLVTMFIAQVEASSPLPTLQAESSETNSTSFSVGEALIKLYSARQKTGDFTIQIKGRRARKVHAFVMHSAWPYFRHMFDAGLKEKQERRLSLPYIDEDGGVDEKALDLIIEVAYNRDLIWQRKQLRPKLSVELALQLLSVSELYLRAHDGETNIFGKLVDECAKFALEDDDHCIKVFNIASEFGMTDIAARAKARIISKLPALTSEESAKQEIEQLPKEHVLDLYFSYCAEQRQ